MQRIIRIIVYGKNNVKKDILTKKNSGTGLLQTDPGEKPGHSPLLSRVIRPDRSCRPGVFGGFGCPVQAGMVQTYPPMICVILAGTTVFSFPNQFAENPFFMRAKRKKDKKTFRTAGR